MAQALNTYNYLVTRGDTLVHQIIVNNPDNTPHDLTGASAVRYTIRQYNYAGAQVVQKTLAGGGVALSDPVAGKLQVTLAATDTAVLIPAQTYVYDCEITLGGQVQTVQTGTITVVGDMSQ